MVTEEAPIGRTVRIENVGQPSEINNGGTSLAPADGGSGSDLSGGRPPGLTYQAFTLEPQVDFVQKLSIIREVEGDYQASTMAKVATLLEDDFLSDDMAPLGMLLERQQGEQDRSLTSEIESSLQRAKDELVKGLLLNQGGELLLDREIGQALEQHLGESPFNEMDEQMDALQTQSLRNAHIVYELGGSIEEAVGQYQEPAHRVFPSGGGFVYGLNKAKAPRDSGGKAPRYSILVDSGPPGGGGASGGYGGRGGSGGNWNGGGGHFGGYLMVFILCGSGLLLLRVVYDYCSHYLYAKAEEAFRAMMKDYHQKTEKVLGSDRHKLSAVLKAATPLLLSGASLFVMSYIFNPERVRAIFSVVANLIALLAQELGRALVAALPHQLREAAQQLGHVLAVLSAHLRNILENVVLPALLWCRAAGIVICCAYLLFNGACELYKLLEPQVALTAATDSDPREAVLLFCLGLLKSASVFILAFLPKNKAALALGGGVLIGGAILAPPHYYQPLATFVLSSPTFAKVVGCVAGRWACIIFVGYMANTATLRRFLPLFVGAGYFFRVYELAMTATPNLLPITPA